MVNEISLASSNALIALWESIKGFLPIFFSGLIVFIIGLIFGKGFGLLVERIINLLKVDSLLEKIGFKQVTDRAGLQLNSGYFLGQLVRWIVILAFLVAACNIWGLTAFGEFLKSIVNYLPNIIVAILILLGAVVLGEYFAKFVKASITGAGLRYEGFLSSLSRWVFYIFGILAALSQLKVAPYIVNTLFTGIIAMIALAGGLAFGLGGQEVARELLRKIKEDLERK
jgi:large-conductance mechanosensitive channel